MIQNRKLDNPIFLNLPNLVINMTSFLSSLSFTTVMDERKLRPVCTSYLLSELIRNLTHLLARSQAKAT
jgi:hypothetical protein